LGVLLLGLFLAPHGATAQQGAALPADGAKAGPADGGVKPGAAEQKPVIPQAAKPPSGCFTPAGTPAVGTSIETATTGAQRKVWQPRGGDLQFTLKSVDQLDPKARVFVCFSWKIRPDTNDKSQAVGPIEGAISSLELLNGTTLKVGTAVPDLPRAPERVERTALVIPVVEVRILVLSSAGTGEVEPKKPVAILADATTTIGVTNVLDGIITTIITLVLVFLGLFAVKAHRPKMVATGKRLNPIIALVTTVRGYASLSQLQVLLWTFVIGASAVYVMALSGTLINISDGTLVLLGIFGATVITSKVKSDSDDAKAAVAPPAPIPARTPRWSDLVINEIRPTNGPVVREVDVTRVQMLYFTVIAAGFVLISVVTNYVIPEIPPNFLILMGISNGVYVTAKYVQR
jgi:hypothetical protein